MSSVYVTVTSTADYRLLQEGYNPPFLCHTISIQTDFIMPLSTESKKTIAESLKADFFQFINEEYDLRLSELLAGASLEFIAETFGGQMDPELECELASALIEEAYINL